MLAQPLTEWAIIFNEPSEKIGFISDLVLHCNGQTLLIWCATLLWGPSRLYLWSPVIFHVSAPSGAYHKIELHCWKDNMELYVPIETGDSDVS